jgi:hypothetical protein
MNHPSMQAALAEPVEIGYIETSCMKWQLKDRPDCEIWVEKALEL